MIRLTTGRRLHFGLFTPVPLPKLNLVHGGLGIIVDAVGVELQAERSSTWEIVGKASAQVDKVLEQLRTSTIAPVVAHPLRIQISCLAPAHQGWGIGTQLALALSRIWCHFAEVHWDVEQGASWLGRGRRSRIGLYGFDHPGFIIDPGKSVDLSSLGPVASIPFPENWTWLIYEPKHGTGLHGEAEHSALAQLMPPDPAMVARLIELGTKELPRALAQRNFREFASGLTKYNRMAGSFYYSIQGGEYCSSAAQKHLEFMQANGILGMGQSSWGPGLFALFPTATEAIDFQQKHPCENYHSILCSVKTAPASVLNEM